MNNSSRFTCIPKAKLQTLLREHALNLDMDVNELILRILEIDMRLELIEDLVITEDTVSFTKKNKEMVA